MLYQVDGFPYYVRLHVCWNCVGTIPSALGHLYLLNVHKTDYTCYYSNMIHCIYNADAPLSFIFYPEQNAFLNYTPNDGEKWNNSCFLCKLPFFSFPVMSLPWPKDLLRAV
jgi:hypothetical protein